MKYQKSIISSFIAIFFSTNYSTVFAQQDFEPQKQNKKNNWVVPQAEKENTKKNENISNSSNSSNNTKENISDNKIANNIYSPLNLKATDNKIKTDQLLEEILKSNKNNKNNTDIKKEKFTIDLIERKININEQGSSNVKDNKDKNTKTPPPLNLDNDGYFNKEIKKSNLWSSFNTKNLTTNSDNNNLLKINQEIINNKIKEEQIQKLGNNINNSLVSNIVKEEKEKVKNANWVRSKFKKKKITKDDVLELSVESNNLFNIESIFFNDELLNPIYFYEDVFIKPTLKEVNSTFNSLKWLQLFQNKIYPQNDIKLNPKEGKISFNFLNDFDETFDENSFLLQNNKKYQVLHFNSNVNTFKLHSLNFEDSIIYEIKPNTCDAFIVQYHLIGNDSIKYESYFIDYDLKIYNKLPKHCSSLLEAQEEKEIENIEVNHLFNVHYPFYNKISYSLFLSEDGKKFDINEFQSFIISKNFDYFEKNQVKINNSSNFITSYEGNSTKLKDDNYWLLVQYVKNKNNQTFYKKININKK